MDILITLIPFLPLLGAAVNGLVGARLPERVVGWLGSGAVLVSFLFSLYLFAHLHGGAEPVRTTLYTFIAVDSFHVDFAFLVDPLSVWMMLIVTGVGFLIHVYSIGYMHGDAGFWRFFAYLNLFIFSMLLLVMGDNLVMLFFGWEGVGLCSYLLIGFWYDNRAYGKAARKAFIMNRIGDLGLLLGLFLIFAIFDSFAYADIFARLPVLRLDPAVLTAIGLLLFVGAIGKSAQIPLFTWLPDAMAGPTPVSALIHAATMVTAGIYLVARCHPLYSLAPTALEVMAFVGLLTSLVAGLIALRQNDIKKVLAYSTVSQLGLMFLALGMGAYAAAMFHVTTHAFFKALLFLGAGSVIHALGGEQDIRRMGGLRKALPLTYWTFLLATLAISGVPLLSGFFSKDEILANVFAGAGSAWWAMAALGGGLTALYMSRLLFVTFFGTFRGTEEQRAHLHESPRVMTVPLLILAVLSVAGGLLNLPHLLHVPGAEWLAHFLSPSVGESRPAHLLSAQTEWLLMGAASLLALGVIAWAYWAYGVRQGVPKDETQLSRWERVLAGKFYFDEFYDWAIVRPVERLSQLLHYYADVWAIDGLVNGVGSAVQRIGAEFRRLQNGNIEYYLIGMVVGAVLLFLSLWL
jgi:NADH-quinone oxidoreductase subunit L